MLHSVWECLSIIDTDLYNLSHYSPHIRKAWHILSSDPALSIDLKELQLIEDIDR